MDCFRPKLITASQMTHFHSDDYINFLRLITPGIFFAFHRWGMNLKRLVCWCETDNMADYVRQLQRFNIGDDCPVFDGLYEYCQIYTSGSIGKDYCFVFQIELWLPFKHHIRWSYPLE